MKLDKSTTFSDLKESGKYSDYIIKSLMNNKIKVLNDLPRALKGDADFMEPILYAVKNELKTYKVYKYMGENLQNNFAIASQIIVDEPELIKDTPISHNKQFFVTNANINPKIIEYMHPIIKSDSEFIGELVRNGDIELKKTILLACDVSVLLANNKELCSDKEFMSLAINQDVSFFKYASLELKDDMDFVRAAIGKEPDLLIEASERIRNSKKCIQELTYNNVDAMVTITRESDYFGDEALDGVISNTTMMLRELIRESEKESGRSSKEEIEKEQTLSEVGETPESVMSEVIEEDKERPLTVQEIEKIEEMGKNGRITEDVATLVLTTDIISGKLQSRRNPNRIDSHEKRNMFSEQLIAECWRSLPEETKKLFGDSIVPHGMKNEDGEKKQRNVDSKRRGKTKRQMAMDKRRNTTDEAMMESDEIIETIEGARIKREEIVEATTGVKLGDMTRVRNEIELELEKNVEMQNPEIE